MNFGGKCLDATASRCLYSSCHCRQFKKKSQRISEKHFVLVENLRLEAVDELANNATY